MTALFLFHRSFVLRPFSLLGLIFSHIFPPGNIDAEQETTSPLFPSGTMRRNTGTRVAAVRGHGDANNATTAGNGLMLNKRGLRKFRDIARENPKIEFIYLRENEFTTFDPYIALENLKLLDLSINNLTGSVDFLVNMPNLRHLYLTGNRISTLAGIQSLLHLETLCMSDNAVSSFEGLDGLPNLRVLSLNYNNIRSFQFYPYLPALHTLNLVGNPVAAIPSYRQMAVAASSPALHNIDGIQITAEERDSVVHYRGKVVYCITEGWVLEGSQPEESAEQFLLKFQRESWKAKPLQLQSFALAPVDGGNLPREGVALRLHACMQDVRPIAARDAEVFCSQFLFPVAFKVSGDAMEVFVVGNMNRWTDPIPLERCEDPATNEVFFHTTLYLPAGDYEYRYIVDGAEKVTEHNKTTSKFQQGLCNLYHVSEAVGRDEGDHESILHIRWMRGNAENSFTLIEGENGLSYMPQPTDIGMSIRAEVLAYDKGDFSFLYFDISTPIASGPPTISDLEIKGNVAEGDRLTVSYTYSGGQEGETTLAWFRVGANGEETPLDLADPWAGLELMLDDTGSRIRVEVTPVRDDWVAGPPQSKVTPIVTAGVPRCRSIAIVGELVQDSALEAQVTYAGGFEGTSKFQWFRFDEASQQFAPIAGQTSKRYIVGLQDVRSRLAVEYVPVSRDSVEGEPARCVLSIHIAPAKPRIRSIVLKGRCEEQAPLALELDYFGGYPGNHQIQWYRRDAAGRGGTVPIGRPNAAIFALTKNEVGFFIDVTVVPVRDDGVCGDPVTVSTEEKIRPGLPQLLAFQVSGVAKVGNILEVFVEYAGGEQGESIIEWAREGQDARSYDVVAKRTKKYVVQREDAGKMIRMSYTPVRADGLQGETKTRMLPVPAESD